jgi:anti-sigma-K factor RskA
VNADLHSLSGAYAVDALDADERGAFEAHLRQCETCRDEVAELHATAARLGDATASTPPPQLREDVLAQAKVTRQDSPLAPVTPIDAIRSRRMLWLAGVAAAAVVVAAGLGVVAYRADQRADQLAVADQQIEQVLSDPEATSQTLPVVGGGQGTLVVSPGTDQGLLVTAGLASAGPDRTYQLWAISKGAATSLGLLPAPRDGTSAKVFVLPGGTATFGMTVEPAGGSPQPTTEPVLLADLSA